MKEKKIKYAKNAEKILSFYKNEEEFSRLLLVLKSIEDQKCEIGSKEISNLAGISYKIKKLNYL